MSHKPRILAFAGSLREGSFNKRLVRIAAAGAQRAGAEVTTIDLADYPMPIYDGDHEERDGLPDNATRLKEIFRAHDGLLISSPEYNSSVSAALKNAIDWVSRPEKDRAPLDCFADKIAGIMAASPGALGGLRGLVHLRAILGNIKVTVIPDQVAIPSAHDAFGDDGKLSDERKNGQIEEIGRRVAGMVAKLRAS